MPRQPPSIGLPRCRLKLCCNNCQPNMSFGEVFRDATPEPILIAMPRGFSRRWMTRLTARAQYYLGSR